MADQGKSEDGVLAKLDAIMSRLGEHRDDDEDRPGKPVPYDRFFRANERAKAAEMGLKEMRAELDALRARFDADVKTLREQAAAEVGRLAGLHSEDLSLRDMGLDGDGRDALRSAWGRLPEDRRGKGPSEWWGTVLEAHKAHGANPEKGAAPEVPRTLAAYLPALEQQKTTETTKQPPAYMRGLTTDRNTQNGGAKHGLVEQINAAAASGDWKLYRELLNKA